MERGDPRRADLWKRTFENLYGVLHLLFGPEAGYGRRGENLQYLRNNSERTTLGYRHDYQGSIAWLETSTRLRILGYGHYTTIFLIEEIRFYYRTKLFSFLEVAGQSMVTSKKNYLQSYQTPAF